MSLFNFQHRLIFPSHLEKAKKLWCGRYETNPTISFHNFPSFGFPFSDEFVGKAEPLLAGEGRDEMWIFSWEWHKKRINLSSDLKTFILISFLCHYLKWKIFHFGSLEDFATFSTEAKMRETRARTKWNKKQTQKKNCSISVQFWDRRMKKPSWLYRDLATAIVPQSLFFPWMKSVEKQQRNDRRNTDVNVSLKSRNLKSLNIAKVHGRFVLLHSLFCAAVNTNL